MKSGLKELIMVKTYLVMIFSGIYRKKKSKRKIMIKYYTDNNINNYK